MTLVVPTSSISWHPNQDACRISPFESYFSMINLDHDSWTTLFNFDPLAHRQAKGHQLIPSILREAIQVTDTYPKTRENVI
jgi:hypothetical protein